MIAIKTKFCCILLHNDMTSVCGNPPFPFVWPDFPKMMFMTAKWVGLTLPPPLPAKLVSWLPYGFCGPVSLYLPLAPGHLTVHQSVMEEATEDTGPAFWISRFFAGCRYPLSHLAPVTPLGRKAALLTWFPIQLAGQWAGSCCHC